MGGECAAGAGYEGVPDAGGRLGVIQKRRGAGSDYPDGVRSTDRERKNLCGDHKAWKDHGVPGGRQAAFGRILAQQTGHTGQKMQRHRGGGERV